MAIFIAIFVIILIMMWRIYAIYSLRQKVISLNDKNIRTLIFLGSGGHTGEMMKIVSKLNFEKHSPRFYVIAATDSLSSKKVEQVEPSTGNLRNYHIHHIPRSREVGQSWISTIYSTLYSLLFSFSCIYKTKPDLILCNGPGSCVPICIASFIFKLFGLASTRLIFIESICRVKSLSLSGKILYYFCDDIFVQWSHLVKKYPNAKYLGRLI